MYHLHKSLVLKILIISAPLATENKIFQNAPQSNAGVGFGILAHSPLHCQTAIENFPKKKYSGDWYVPFLYIDALPPNQLYQLSSVSAPYQTAPGLNIC